MSKKLVAFFSVSGMTARADAGKRLGGEVSEADLKIWTEGMQL